jgi:hypothetical protein
MSNINSTPFLWTINIFNPFRFKAIQQINVMIMKQISTQIILHNIWISVLRKHKLYINLIIIYVPSDDVILNEF